jgi:hypothetical protein
MARAIDQPWPYPVSGQLGGEGQAGGSSADDEDVDRVAAHDLTVEVRIPSPCRVFMPSWCGTP